MKTLNKHTYLKWLHQQKKNRNRNHQVLKWENHFIWIYKLGNSKKDLVHAHKVIPDGAAHFEGQDEAFFRFSLWNVLTLFLMLHF